MINEPNRGITWPVIITNVVCLLGVMTFISTEYDCIAQFGNPEIVRSNDFVLTESQAAAGIDGRLKISLDVDDKGNVKKAEIIAGPIWPCKQTPHTELDEFRSAAIKNARTFKFIPPNKNGKPTKSTIILTVTVGNAYKASLETKDVKNPEYLDANIVNGRAISLPKPVWPSGANRAGGYVSVDIIIDKEGNVESAGTLLGPNDLHKTSREAACKAKFSPTLLNGKPVVVTGRITYNFVPNLRF